VLRKLKSLTATVFFIGHIPGAPGTFASVAAAAAFIAAGMPAGAPGLGTALALALAGLWAASGAEGLFGEADPKPVVIDEVAGMYLALVVGGARGMPAVAAVFVIFRLLDVLKPFGIRRIERLGGARGIMADDLAAGVLSGAVVRLLQYFQVF